MKRRIIMSGFMILASVFCLTGCGDSKEAKEARSRGIAQMNEGQYTEAIASFDKALNEADGIVNNFELDILKYRGEAEYALGDYKAAVHTYDILLDVDEQPEYFYCRAAARARSGDLPGALEDYETAQSVDIVMGRNVSGGKLATSAIGRAYTDSGDYEAAMTFFQDAENGGKADAGLYNQMGLCMIAGKQYDEAVVYFDKGLETADEKQTQELLYNKGTACEFIGDFAKAKEIFEKYKATYGTTPELEKELAFLNSRQ